MKQQISGFTLIELLIVVSITVLFAGISTAQYNTQTQHTKLKNEARKFADVLELAKKKATSSDLIVTPLVTPPTYCTNFTGYRVDLNSSNYLLRFGCNGVYQTIQTYDLPFNITTTPNNGNFDFLPLGLGTNITINTVRVKNTSTDQCFDISISQVGVIEVDETLISCP